MEKRVQAARTAGTPAQHTFYQFRVSLTKEDAGSVETLGDKVEEVSRARMLKGSR